jgi:hypothetical protein
MIINISRKCWIDLLIRYFLLSHSAFFIRLALNLLCHSLDLSHPAHLKFAMSSATALRLRPSLTVRHGTETAVQLQASKLNMPTGITLQ